MKISLWVVLVLSLSVMVMAGCASTVDLNTYADKIEAQLQQNKPLGYAFVVSRPTQTSVARAGGSARLQQDPPELPMSVDVKYNVASVSKDITAAAVMTLLNDTDIKQQDLSLDEKLDEKIVDYLPYNWKPGPGVDSITFRQALKHRTGIRCTPDFVDYQNLKQCLAQGIVVENKDLSCDKDASGTLTGTGQPLGANDNGCYMNANYALFRVIIPVMLGKIVKPVLSPPTEDQTDQENAALAADVYINYVNDHVFAKAGLPKIFCAPTDGAQQGFAYKLAELNSKGTDFGDSTLLCGSEGWFLSAAQMSTYFQALNATDKIVAPVAAVRMRSELFGYDGVTKFTTAAGPITRWSKAGGFPASNNPGEINTLLVFFSNSVAVAIAINSDLPSGFSYDAAITNAMADLLNGK